MKRLFSESPIFRVLSAFLALAVMLGGLHFVRSGSSTYSDFPCTSPSSEQVSIEIPAGATGSEVANLLFHAEVIASSESYFRVAVRDQRSNRVAPGSHVLNKHLCATVALEQLLDSKRQSGLITVIEGAWVSEIIPQLVASGFKLSDVQQAISAVKKPAGFSSVEGLLFPALYSFDKSTTAQSAIQSMVDKSVSQMDELGYFKAKEFTPFKLLTIASLVQAEGNAVDYAKISRVIRNRLKVGMPLQFDSTVHYIKKSRGSVFLSTQSTFIASPYNTYRHYGLPPGPINNPGQLAMQAALNPAQGDWLYFITVAPHDTRYTSSLEEFNLWKALYKKNLRNGLFRSSQ